MRKPLLKSILPALLCIGSAAAADQDLDAAMEQAGMRETIGNRTDGALLDQSTALEQAKTQASSRSDYGIELRPSIGDNDAGLALRVYLPDRWSRKRLHEQLTLAAQSEQLRVASLEWSAVISVYGDFCNYRMLRKQLALLEDERKFIEPYLAQADQSVEQRQLAMNDRARLYSTYLALANDCNEAETALIDLQQKLRLVLGPEADLETLSATATIQMPSQLQIETLLREALEKRADFRRWEVDIHSMQLAEDAARAADGFRLKYIQPSYSVDYGNGENSWELSASIILPWGTRNPDIAVYQHQQALSIAAKTQQRQIIEDKLRVLLATTESYYAQAAKRNRSIKPVIERLNSDLVQMADTPLQQIRDVLSIRERLLETKLQTTESQSRLERTAVDLANELGSM